MIILLKNITGSTLLHPILFSIFPVIFLYSQSDNILPFRGFIFPLFLSIFVTLLLLIVVRYVLKNKPKSALIVSLFVFLSLTFGHFKNLLSSYEGIFEITDIHVFTLFGILVIGGSFYFIKTKRKLDNATIITNSVAVILVVMVLVNIGTYNFEKSFYDEFNDYTPNQSLSISEKFGSPDVYILVLDAYENQMVLQKFFDYDNQEFIDSLIDQGFFVSNTYTNSNYDKTDFSVPSILNMDYVHNLVPSGVSDKYKVELRNKLTNNNIVMKNFKALGYKNIGLDSGWIGTRVVDIADENLCEKSNDSRILNLLKEISIFQSLSLIIANDLGKDLNQNILNEFDKVPIDHEKRQKVFCNFSELPQIHQKFEKPVFVFWHILSPHTPWVFDSNGDPPLEKVSSLMKNVKKRQMAYLNEMEFINKKIIDSTKKLILESDNEPIIIILSDHGTRIVDNERTEDEKNIIRYGNLMAFYLPNDVEPLAYETTPVNIFRLIFNSYFNGDYKILENKVFDKSEKEIVDWEKKVNNVFG